MKINILIIDDNPNWRKTLSAFVRMVPTLHLVGTCASALEAYARLADTEIDLIICDIEMPDLTGLGFARSLRSAPLILFVTSHPHYALDCYEVSPVDFLLKPLEPERFMRSIEKVRQRLLTAPESFTLQPYFFVREGYDYMQVLYHDVLYMRAQEHFLEIVTNARTYVPQMPINKMEDQLKGDVFLRVHRSYLVHRLAISRITKDTVYLHNGVEIPIGEQYRSKINRVHMEGRLISRV